MIPSNSHKKDIVSFKISRNNKFILTCAFEEPLRLWDKSSGDLIREFKHDDMLTNVLISPNDKYIIASGERHIIYIWNLFTGELLKQIGCNCISIAISPDSHYFISTNRDSEFILYRIEDGALMRKFIGHESYINYVAFTPDCNNVVSVSNDNTVKVWDINTGIILCEFQIYDSDLQKKDNFVTTAILSPDGKYIAIPLDNCLKIWNITSEVPIQSLPFRITYNTGNTFFSLAYSQDGIYLGMSDGDIIYVWKNFHTD